MSEGSIPDVSHIRHSAAFGGCPVLDGAALQSLREIAGDDDLEFVLEIIELFLDDTGQRIQRLRQAALAGDLEAVASGAHALGSASASVGAVTLSAGCAALESATRGAGGEEVRLGVEQVGGMFAEVRETLLWLRAGIHGS